MKKFFVFLKGLLREAKANEITVLATKLTYHLIFALFPFLVFLISLVGFFNIHPDYLMMEVSAILPTQIAEMVNLVINDVVDTRNPSILTTSLIIAVYTVANGFRSIMRGINRVYRQEDGRHNVKKWALCLLLVLILSAAIISSLITIIFGVMGLAIAAAILLFAIVLIYRLSSSVKHPFLSMLPGSVLTMVVWGISSWGFSLYITNFSNHSLIYGPITSIILTMLWLNIISITILFGAQLNAQIMGFMDKFSKKA
ncbi:MAG: YihY/virulence factor BrkB family protein [Defluviitaleaceae bacterium]|nr:YihY/virulence factor BrkB family protein [Defluviitaleaceae bacterium]